MSVTGTNRLLLPLIAVSLLCAAEAVYIAFLLGRGTDHGAGRPPAVARDSGAADASSPAMPPASSATAPAGAMPATPPPSSPSVTRGKVGQRVESGGLAVTAVAVSDKPRYDVFAPRPDEKFLDVDVLLECDAPGGVRYFSNEFKLQDDQSRVYNGGALGVGDPQLGFGTLVRGAKARGHVAFTVPKDAKGLTLTYPAPEAPGGPRAVHIDLGQ